MKVSGNRSRTINDYFLHVEHFQSITNVQLVTDITSDAIYSWLDSMSVSNQTKLLRLKCLKAFLPDALIVFEAQYIQDLKANNIIFEGEDRILDDFTYLVKEINNQLAGTLSRMQKADIIDYYPVYKGYLMKAGETIT